MNCEFDDINLSDIHDWICSRYYYTLIKQKKGECNQFNAQHDVRFLNTTTK